MTPSDTAHPEGETQTPIERAEPGPFAKLVEQEWQTLLDKDDRTSPEDYPDMCLITRVELAWAMSEAFFAGTDAARSAQRSEEAPHKALQKDAGLPHPPTALTYECRIAVNGEGPRALDWSDKPHRLVYDLCRELEAQAASPPSRPQGEARDAVATYLRDWMLDRFGKRIFKTTADELADATLALLSGSRPQEGLARHRFWGAGEPDCPKDIKAGNGELHTLRCKACGLDNPRNDGCGGAGVPDDVARLVVAARIVAHEDQGKGALNELDQASEAFASRVRWDDEPEEPALSNQGKPSS